MKLRTIHSAATLLLLASAGGCSESTSEFQPVSDSPDPSGVKVVIEIPDLLDVAPLHHGILTDKGLAPSQDVTRKDRGTARMDQADDHVIRDVDGLPAGESPGTKSRS